MLPIQVKLLGFMSYRDEATLNFDGSPLWMLSGHNGAGKSTVFDAMKFALYGTHRLGSQFAEGLIHHDASFLSVEFDFQVGPDVYRVVRTLPRGGRATFQAFHIKGPNSPRPGIEGPHAIAETDSKAGLKRFVENHVGLNEETFSSAVMLQQGKSDALLSADAEARHGVLSQIVDLTAFEELHKRAEEGYKMAKGTAEHVKRQLASCAPVDECAIERLSQEIEQLQESLRVQRTRRDTLLRLRPQAERWEELNQEIANLEDEIKAREQILQQGDSLHRDVARLGELEEQLPPLRELASLWERATELENAIVALGRGQQKAQEDAQNAAAEKKGHQQRQDELICEIKRHEEQRDEAQTTLIEIGPQLQPQRDWLGLQRELAQHDQNLATFAPDLDDRLQQTQTELEEANEIRRVLPELKRLIQVRRDWNTARDIREQAREQLVSLDDEINKAQNALSHGEARVKNAETAWSETQKAGATAATLLQSAQEAMARFAEIEHEPTCHYCGQALDESHLALEQARLQSELEAAQGRDRAASDATITAHSELMMAQSARGNAQQTLDALSTQRQETLNADGNATRDIIRTTQEAEQIVLGLPESWRAQIRGAVAENTTPAEIASSFPDESQLKTLEVRAGSQATLQSEAKELGQKIEQRRRLQDARENARRRFETLDFLCRDLPANLQQRHDEAKRLSESAKRVLVDLTNQIAVLSRSIESVQERLSRAEQVINATSVKLAENRSSVAGVQTQIESLRQKLPPIYTDVALDVVMLRSLEEEKTGLEKSTVRKRAQQLAAIAEEQRNLVQRVDHLKGETAKIPAEAQVLPSQLIAEEEQLRKDLGAAEARVSVQEQERNTLASAKEQRTRWQKELQDAEKNTRLHKEIAEKLGRDWLQRQLLLEAEIKIIDAANDVLDRISGGELRLELRTDDTPEVAGTRKGASRALDFVVYNSQLGQSPPPMHPALLSGSQRFRVAVSLALGIGHYASHGKGRVESVIIDEGFGSLDKQGRQEMIEELRELKTVLKRVILVSHQEEFSEAFANRYHIEIVDGTSRVSLFDLNSS